MQQQINLYVLLPKQAKIQASLKKMLFIYGAFIIFLLLISLFDIRQQHQYSNQLTQLQDQLTIKKQQLTLLISKYPMLNPKDLDTSMKQLQDELDIKNKMVALLSEGSGFSPQFKAFALSSVRGAWLTNMVISIKDRHIGLKGQALIETAVYQFLNQLVHQPVFVNTPLELRELTNTDTGNNRYLNFYIATKATT